MFDFYSQSRGNTRNVAFLHSKNSPTWPDMVSQNRDTDIDVRLYKTSSESLISLFVASISARFHRWQLNLGNRPAKKVQIHTDYLPVKHQSPIRR